MNMKQKYLPEGCLLHTEDNLMRISSRDGLREAARSGALIEGIAARCTPSHDLLVDLPCGQAIIPRVECALGIQEGETREVAILSRVGRPVCCRVRETDAGELVLSRRAAQQQALTYFTGTLHPGDVVCARVTHLEPFGVFVDIGCGVTSFIGIEHLSVSRIFHPRERFQVGQPIHAAVLCVDQERGRIALTHRELLGTWSENASHFKAGETVSGVVRSLESYGVFIELTPNLSGLAEPREGLQCGDRVSVYIKSILPERMKIKLSIIDVLHDRPPFHPPLRYYITEGHLDQWIYTPECCSSKYISTVFGQDVLTKDGKCSP